MTARKWRLMTTPVRYKVTGSDRTSHTDPDNRHQVAALHDELCRDTDTRVASTVLQHQDPRTGSWIDHGGTA